MIVIVTMTLSSVITQKPMYEYFGVEGCYFFWTVNNIYMVEATLGGFGMAIFRLVCFHFLFKKEINTKELMKNILLYGKVAIFVIMLTTASGVALSGMETAIFYQFCMNLGPTQAKVLHEYDNPIYNHMLVKFLRTGPAITCQMMIIGELMIYLWLLYQLRIHDKQIYQEGIITSTMVLERKRKNVITLYGQVTSFVVEIVMSIYVIIHALIYPSITDPSVMTINSIVTFTAIALTQFFTSHDMRRFVKEVWNVTL